MSERPCHGYELKSEFDRLTGGLWDLNVGQIYSTLERLLKDRLVELEEGEGTDEERKVYRLTPEGLSQLELWLSRPPLKTRPRRDEVYVRLALLLDRDPPAALDLVEQQRRLYQVEMAELTRQKITLMRGSAADRNWQSLLVDAAILHVEADLRWLDLCAAKFGGTG